MHIRRWGLRSGVVLAAVALLAAACGSDDDDAERAEAGIVADADPEGGEDAVAAEAANAEDDDAEDDGAEADGAEDDGAEDDGAEAAVVEPDDPPDGPLATAEGSPGFAELEITDLRRVDDTVTLEFVVITDNSSGSRRRPSEVPFASAEDRDGDHSRTVSGVTLVDTVNNNRHLVLRDSSGRCLCTNWPFGVAASDSRFTHSAQFPAPPADVAAMTVQVPGFPSVDNVPLRRAG